MAHSRLFVELSHCEQASCCVIRSRGSLSGTALIREQSIPTQTDSESHIPTSKQLSALSLQQRKSLPQWFLIILQHTCTQNYFSSL